MNNIEEQGIERSIHLLQPLRLHVARQATLDVMAWEGLVTRFTQIV